MNYPRTEMRKENQIQDLQSKEKFLERKKENLRIEIDKVDQKVMRLNSTKKSYEHDIEEINSLQEQIHREIEELRSLSLEQPRQGQSQNSLESLYKDHPYLRGKPLDEIPPSIRAEYNL
jgi:chromosome segregation ATPase